MRIMLLNSSQTFAKTSSLIKFILYRCLPLAFMYPHLPAFLTQAKPSLKLAA
jgi:hypothetical protein